MLVPPCFIRSPTSDLLLALPFIRLRIAGCLGQVEFFAFSLDWLVVVDFFAYASLWWAIVGQVCLGKMITLTGRQCVWGRQVGLCIDVHSEAAQFGIGPGHSYVAYLAC